MAEQTHRLSTSQAAAQATEYTFTNTKHQPRYTNKTARPPMSYAGGMPSHTSASSIVAKPVLVSHDLVINGYSFTKNWYPSGTYIKTEKFVGGGRRWYLRYYPNGCDTREYFYYDRDVTFVLYHDDDNGTDEDKVPVKYQISLLGPDGCPVQRYQSELFKVIYDDPSIHRPGLIKRMDLEQSSYLKDDAFSVRCEFSVPMIVRETTILPPTEEPAPSCPTPTHVPADVHEGLVRVFSAEVSTDVALEVGCETFEAHRCLLAAQSPVFAALFAGPMRETTAPSVPINDMEPRVFKAMLDFIYKGNLQLPTLVDNDEGDDPIAMTQHILVAADRYDLNRLKSICAEKLLKHINTTTVATTLDLAHRHGCHDLKDACFDFLAPQRGNLKAILKSDGFEQLIVDFPSVVVELLARVAPSPLSL